MDWTDPTANESAEENEVEMSSLIAVFVARMLKRAASAQEETTPDSKGPDKKRFKHFGPVEEVQINPTMIPWIL